MWWGEEGRMWWGRRSYYHHRLHLRSAISVLLAAVGCVTTEAAKSLDNSGSDGLLEGSSPEHRHVVGGVGELEEDRQVVLGLRGGLAQGEEDERRADNLSEHVAAF